jgi:hypothetical protein
MKKITFGMLTVGLLLISSCAKNSNAVTTYGSWVFKSNTYGEVTSRHTSGGTLLTASPNNSGSTMTLSFMNTLPGNEGAFTVVSGTPVTAKQVRIDLTVGSTTGGTYTSLSTYSQTVYVTIGSNNMINVSGNNILMQSTATPSDTTRLSFSVTQLQ